MRKRVIKRTRTPRKVILVICEGETEANYVELLKRHYRLPIMIKTKVVGNKITPRLVSAIRREFSLLNDDECILVYIYDADVSEMVEKLNSLPGNTYLSNPSIELWFLFHVVDLKRSISSKDLLKLLQSASAEWNSYTKGMFNSKQETLLLSNKEAACRRGQESRWPHNPSTNLHLFIELLEKLKNC